MAQRMKVAFVPRASRDAGPSFPSFPKQLEYSEKGERAPSIFPLASLREGTVLKKKPWIELVKPHRSSKPRSDQGNEQTVPSLRRVSWRNIPIHSSSRQKADRRHKFVLTPWSQHLQYNQAAWRACVPFQKK